MNDKLRPRYRGRRTLSDRNGRAELSKISWLPQRLIEPVQQAVCRSLGDRPNFPMMEGKRQWHATRRHAALRLVSELDLFGRRRECRLQRPPRSCLRRPLAHHPAGIRQGGRLVRLRRKERPQECADVRPLHRRAAPRTSAEQCIEAVEAFWRKVTQDRIPWHFALHLELDQKNEPDWNPHTWGEG